jgi:hypothetical protein
MVARVTEINLRGIRRFNSTGVREWIDVLVALSTRARFVFVECSPAVIQQANQVHGFLAGAPVLSEISAGEQSPATPRHPSRMGARSTFAR